MNAVLAFLADMIGVPNPNGHYVSHLRLERQRTKEKRDYLSRHRIVQDWCAKPQQRTRDT